MILKILKQLYELWVGISLSLYAQSKDKDIGWDRQDI